MRDSECFHPHKVINTWDICLTTFELVKYTHVFRHIMPHKYVQLYRSIKMRKEIAKTMKEQGHGDLSTKRPNRTEWMNQTVCQESVGRCVLDPSFKWTLSDVYTVKWEMSGQCGWELACEKDVGSGINQITSPPVYRSHFIHPRKQ